MRIEIYTPESGPEKNPIHFSHVIYTHLYLSKQITRYLYDLSIKYMFPCELSFQIKPPPPQKKTYNISSDQVIFTKIIFHTNSI